MLEPELVRGSPTRTGGDRGLAGGLQHRAPAQLAKVSDAGRVRRKCGHATGVSPHAGRFHRPDVGRFGCAGTPEKLSFGWTKFRGAGQREYRYLVAVIYSVLEYSRWIGCCPGSRAGSAMR